MTGKRQPRRLTTDETMFVEQFRTMSADQKRVWMYLGRLYLVRERAPSAEVDAEIAKLEAAMRAGELPDVPRTQ